MRNHSIHKKDKSKTALDGFWDASEYLLCGLSNFMTAHEYLWGNLRDRVTHSFDEH